MYIEGFQNKNDDTGQKVQSVPLPSILAAASKTNNILVPLEEVWNYRLCTKTVRRDKQGWLMMWEIQFIQERLKNLNMSKMDRYKDNLITLLRWLKGHKRNQCIYVLQPQESDIYSCNWALVKERFEATLYIKNDFFF